jgi:hypothetical protein
MDRASGRATVPASLAQTRASWSLGVRSHALFEDLTEEIARAGLRRQPLPWPDGRPYLVTSVIDRLRVVHMPDTRADDA